MELVTQYEWVTLQFAITHFCFLYFSKCAELEEELKNVTNNLKSLEAQAEKVGVNILETVKTYVNSTIISTIVYREVTFSEQDHSRESTICQIRATTVCVCAVHRLRCLVATRPCVFLSSFIPGFRKRFFNVILDLFVFSYFLNTVFTKGGQV